MPRFKSLRQAQRFLSAHALISAHFRPRRHRMTASRYRATRAKAFKSWTQETCTQSVGLIAYALVRSLSLPSTVNVTMPSATRTA